MHWFEIGMSIITLTVLEIVLGLDNLVILSILTEKLPAKERKKAQYWGLCFAWVTRLILLASAVSLTHLTKPFVVFYQVVFSVRDLFMLAGGGFLIAKATQEIHDELAFGHATPTKSARSSKSFKRVVCQVVIMDVIFSLDSVLTAIGITNHILAMAVAITIAILVMLYASYPMSVFINKYPTIKMLAFSFIILIGMLLIADGFAFHMPRGYLYFAMGFALAVESLNILRINRKNRR